MLHIQLYDFICIYHGLWGYISFLWFNFISYHTNILPRCHMVLTEAITNNVPSSNIEIPKLLACQLSTIPQPFDGWFGEYPKKEIKALWYFTTKLGNAIKYQLSWGEIKFLIIILCILRAFQDGILQRLWYVISLFLTGLKDLRSPV